MQSKSIYHTSYKPLFINDIEKNEVKDFSTNLSNKLRQIKLAISKAQIKKKILKNNDTTKAVDKLNIKSLDSLKIRLTKSMRY